MAGTAAMFYVDRSVLERVLERLGAALDGPGTVFLVGETSLVWAGVRSWTDEVEIAIVSHAGEPVEIEAAVAAVASESGIRIVNEHPGDVIPLPDGWRANSRSTDHRAGEMAVAHFDPYSVAFRFLARGDEEDYRLVIDYLASGWIDMEELDRQLDNLLPRFSFDTIAQDPAEFRRKYKGLQQMAKAKGVI